MYLNKAILAAGFFHFAGLVLPQSVHAQALFFSEANSEMTVGETKTVRVVYSGEKDPMGADFVMRYEPVYVEIIQVVPEEKWVVTAGPQIDDKEGIMRLSLAFESGHTVTGKTAVAAVTYKARQETERTAFTFAFILGQTTDTNLLSNRGKDVLKNVGNLLLTIKKPPLISVAHAVESAIVLPRKDKHEPAFDVLSPVPQASLINPDFRVVESLPQSQEEISDLTFILLIGVVFALVGIAVFLHRLRQMFFDEETTLFSNTSHVNPQV